MNRWLLVSIIVLLGEMAFPGSLDVCATCQYSTIQSAVNSSEPHDTILVRQGIYPTFDLDINQPITLLADGHVILDGKDEGYILKIMSDSVNVSGFTFINSGRSYTKDYAAIYVFGITQFGILNNEIIDPFFGILVEKSKNGKILGNNVHGESKREDDSGNGIHLWHCDSVTLINNEVYGLRDGIYFEFVEHGEIRDNYSHHNIRYGLHFMFSNHDTYFNNTFEDNGSGVAVMFSKFIQMKENKFISNWGAASYGLLLKEIYDAEVIDNEFTENTIAIFTEGSSRVNYTRNKFIRNGWAIKVSGGCYTNHFLENNFTGNSFDVSYNSRMNDNLFERNYWASYSGYDLDKDGFGDVPHRPVKLFSYIVNETPETIVLLRSLFVDIINFSERVSPVFTPDDLVDLHPSINPF